MFALGVRWAAILAACFGLFAAGVLSVSHVLRLPVACGGRLDCLTVALHPASKLLGVPIAFFGVAAYATMLFLLGRPALDRRTRLTIAALAGAGTAVSAGLLLYSRVVIHATCVWCVASGGAMTVLFVLSAVLVRLETTSRAPRSALVGLTLATGLAIVIAGLRMERAAAASPIPVERVTAIGAETLMADAPNIGSKDAPVTVIVFADLLCPPCANALSQLARFQSANSSGVGIVYRHLPLTFIPGHETSEEAAVLSEIAAERSKFWQFVEAVHKHRGAKSHHVYMHMMRGLGFDVSEVEARLNDPTEPAAARVRRDIELAKRLGIEGTPALFVRIGTAAPVSVSQRSLPRVLTSSAALSLLAPPHTATERR